MHYNRNIHISIIINLWDRAPKEQYRRPSLFKGILLYTQRNPSTEIGQAKQKKTIVTVQHFSKIQLHFIIMIQWNQTYLYIVASYHVCDIVIHLAVV